VSSWKRKLRGEKKRGQGGGGKKRGYKKKKNQIGPRKKEKGTPDDRLRGGKRILGVKNRSLNQKRLRRKPSSKMSWKKSQKK